MVTTTSNRDAEKSPEQATRTCFAQTDQSRRTSLSFGTVIIAVGMALSDVITVAIAQTACRIFTAANLSRRYAQ